MKKLIVLLMFMIVAVSTVLAHEEHDNHNHSNLRHLHGSGFNISEVHDSGVISGTFGQMAVWIEQSAKKDELAYRGWVVRGKDKLHVSIVYENNILKADFNGAKFQQGKVDKENRLYVFSKNGKKETVAFFYETQEGRRMANPLFIVENNGKTYLARLEGGCCLNHGLYYAAVIYGLTLLDDSGVESKNRP